MVGLKAQSDNFDIAYPYSKLVHQFAIDSLGYVWFRNAEEIYLFNGHEIHSLNLPSILNKNNKRYHLEGELIFVNKRLLLATKRKIIFLDPQDKSTETIWDVPEYLDIIFTHKDNKGIVWVFTKDKIKNILLVHHLNEKNKIHPAFELPLELSFSLGSDARNFGKINDRFYFFGEYGGLSIFNEKGDEFFLGVENEPDFEKDKNCYMFILDNKSQLWRMKETEFEIYDSRKRTFERHPVSGRVTIKNQCMSSELSGNRLTNLQVDAENNIWIGLGSSFLYMYDEENDNLISFRNSLVKKLGKGGGNIKSLTQDSSGNIWGVKRGGIFKITKKENYFESHLVDTDNEDHPFYEGMKNEFKNKVISFWKDNGVDKSKIKSIAEDGKGNIFFQDPRFTYKLEKDGEEIEVLPFFNWKHKTNLYIDDEVKFHVTWDSCYTFDDSYQLQKKPYSINNIRFFFRQKNGDLWMSGDYNDKEYFLAKINPYSNSVEEEFKDPKGLINFSMTLVYSMSEDEKGYLWLATSEGIFQMHPKEGLLRQINSELEYNGKKIKIKPTQLRVDYVRDGFLWFRNKSQIGYLETQKEELVYYLDDEDLGLENLGQILPVGDSVAWFGNTNGLYHYNFKTQKYVHFSKNKGIDLSDGVRTIRSLKDDRIAVGTHNGMYIFHPDSILQKRTKQEQKEKNIPVFLTAYSILDSEENTMTHHDFLINGIKKIELDYNDKMLEFEYAIMNFDHNDKHAYSYKMEGFDPDWSVPSNFNKAKYTSLPPGSYVFKVRSAANSDIWSDKILTILIVVHEAWFRTWWFYISCIIILSLLIYSLVAYYFRQQLEKRLAIEKLRTKISSDLHDDVGSILTGLAMQTEIMEHTAEGTNKDRLGRISELSRSAMSRMRDAVWAMDSRKDKWSALRDRMNEFASETLEIQEINYTINFDGINLEEQIKADIRQNIYLIFKEAVTNIVKHSTANKVDVVLSKKGKVLELMIHDNGNPKKKKSVSTGLGMSNMKMRAEQINATLSIHEEQGFKILLRVKFK